MSQNTGKKKKKKPANVQQTAASIRQSIFGVSGSGKGSKRK